MGDISRNFSYKEFEVSTSYPKLVERIPSNYRPNVKALVESVLQPLRGCSGWTIKITSGYRGKRLNETVGGATTSQHTKGEASDIQCYEEIIKNGIKTKIKISTYDVMKKIVNLGLEFDQLIGYPTFVHVSFSRTKNRKQILYNKSYGGKKL